MPKVLVCYKWTLDEQDIKVRPEDLTLDVSRAKGKISDFDRNAIEAATALVEAQGGTVDALTYGTEAVKASVKDVLSRGPNQVLWVAGPHAGQADGFVMANVLAAAIRQEGPYDLILCGEGSSDLFNQQLPMRLAALLDLPCVSFAQSFTLAGAVLTATRNLGDCLEEVTVTGPAVVSVLSEINKPRIPTLKQVLGASRKPSRELILALDPGDLQPRSQRRSAKGFVMNRKHILFKEGDAAARVAQLTASLAAEGLH
jgi:electron transfer flavoprotein beta subunit